jgi:two-component system sensor histidine kinase MtrB
VIRRSERAWRQVSTVIGRLPLRLRVMIAFALISSLVSGAVALATWQLSSSYMLTQRQNSAVRQATVNARLVELSLGGGSTGLADLLTGLGSQVESAVLLVDRGQWTSSGNLVDPRQLPPAFLAVVAKGEAARQRTTLNGAPVLAVGLPLPSVSATYVEVFPLRELDHTFRFLSWMLLIGVLASGVIGALLGRWATVRALRPLTDLTAAAGMAADGDLAVRLPETGDRDLASLAHAFNRTAERLQKRVARDARFAGDVSHELRSPLTTLINAAAVLNHRRAQLSESAKQALDLLAEETTRFRRLVDDLLEISLTDEGAPNQELEVVDLVELVSQTAQHTTTAAKIAVLATEPRPQVWADRRRLERAIGNLIDNAERHGNGLTRLSVSSDAAMARIEVDDGGPGIAVSERERVFERFARGHPGDRDDGPGAGLGLALVTQHIRIHQGAVWIEDAPSGGARFVIAIPVART